MFGLLHWTTKYTIVSSVIATEPLEIEGYFFIMQNTQKGSWHGMLGILHI